jgi:hypothetical protein
VSNFGARKIHCCLVVLGESPFSSDPNSLGITTAAGIQLVTETGEYLIGECAESSRYCTLRVRFWVWVVLPDLAVTTMVYAPAGVALGFGVGDGVIELPPPQAHSARPSSGARRQHSLGNRAPDAAWIRTRHPRMASAQSQGVGPPG